jgi:hypothetical protein
LDSDEILKLIPKKYGHKRYLRGIEVKEKKKKAPKTDQKPKKPQTVLMPCMSQKKEIEGKLARNASLPAAKKLVVPPF